MCAFVGATQAFMYIWAHKTHLSIAACIVELNCMLGRRHTFFFLDYHTLYNKHTQTHTHTYTVSLEQTAQEGWRGLENGWRGAEHGAVTACGLKMAWAAIKRGRGQRLFPGILLGVDNFRGWCALACWDILRDLQQLKSGQPKIKIRKANTFKDTRETQHIGWR